ncbi:MAG: CARDB domain-containing protein [Myxococcota bacterium]
MLVLDTGQRRVRFAALPDIIAGLPLWSTLDLGADPTAPDTLLEPQGLAVTPEGHLLVVDTFHARVVLFRLDAGGASYTRDASFAPSLPDATPLTRPRDVAVGADGKVFLLDTANHRVLALDDVADASWSLFAADAAWGQAYGLGVATDGKVAVAATDAHAIYLYPAAGGAASVIGRYGSDERGYRFPRDVAFAPDGGLVVADTLNHRVRVDAPDGAPRFRLDSAGLFDAPVSAACDAAGHIFVVDQGHGQVLAWLGPDAPKPFDLMIRDFVGDVGVEDPVDPVITLSSPDILMRHAPDVDAAAVPHAGLVALPFQEPRYEMPSYLYVEVDNLGPLGSTPGQVRFYWADADSALTFPDDFATSGFYRSWSAPDHHLDGNWLYLPAIAPHGFVVLGPLVWLPPAPESVHGEDGRVDVVARVVHVDDPSLAASGLDGIRHSNDVARRPTTVTRGPFPIGQQDTLVVRARFPGAAPAAAFDVTSERVTHAGQWVSAASHGNAWIDALVLPDPVGLDHDAAYYSADDRTPVLDVATEVLGKLPAGALDGPTADADDDVDRLVVVVNQPAFAHQATTGPWPYVSGGLTRWLTVSIQGPDDDGNVIAHGLGHQLGLEDLLPHEHVVFARPYADGWDNMALPMNGVLPLAWSQDLATWVTEAGGLIRFVPRPGNGVVASAAVDLRYPATLAQDDTVAIAVGLTPGVTTFEQETRFYWIESRSPSVGGFEAPLPGTGVLVYLATEEIPQGQGPVIIRDHVLATPDSLADAAVPVGESESPGGTGLTVHVDAALPDGDGFRVSYSYDPPEIGFDLWMDPGDPTYLSPDIWIDNQTDGYDEEHGVAPHFSEAVAIPDEENRVYAMVRNHGPATAYDVEVAFYFSSPWHTIDGHDAFDYFATAIIPHIDPDQAVPTYVVWTPPADQGEHHCVKVEVRRAVDDTNPDNNAAQRNITVDTSASHSPYPPVVSTFMVANDEAEPKLVIPRLEGVPADWAWSFAPARVLVPAGDTRTVTLTVTPSESTPRCRRYDMQVTGWRPRGDTLVRTGGTQASVLTKRLVELSAAVKVSRCERDPKKGEAALPPWARDPKRCASIAVEGCTVPPQPFAEIVVRYEDPAGNPIYRTVTTDANGCYEDSFISGEGGNWGVDVTYPGDDCESAASAGAEVTLPFPADGDHDDDGLPDAQECQGDPDRDGIPCVLDPDSNNDGVPDGPGEGQCRPAPSGLVLFVLLALILLLCVLVWLWRTCPRPPPLVVLWLVVALVLALVAYWLLLRGGPWCPSLDALAWLLRLAFLLALLVVLRCLRRRLAAAKGRALARG